MNKWLISGLIVVLCGVWAPSAMARGELKLLLPKAKAPASPLHKKVYLQAVEDKRLFQDHPRDANIPSLAAGLEKTTPEQRSHAVGRVRDGNGKARNNLFTIQTQPVATVVRDVVEASLKQQGYTVVSKESDVDTETVRLVVDIDAFWGYIKVVAGGWAGAIPTMEGEMKTTLSIVDEDEATQPWVVSVKVSHKFGLMTAKHWVLMYQELMEAYQTKIPTGKI